MTDYTTLFIGPSGSKRTKQCKIPLNKDELRAPILLRHSPTAVITLRGKDEGYEVRFLKPKGSDYELSLFIDLRRKPNGDVVYSSSTPLILVTPDEAFELHNRAVFSDLLATRSAYQSRQCAVDDRNYAVAHTLVDLEAQYMAILEQYNKTPTWYTTLLQFLYVAINALVTEDIQILEPWYAMHRDITNTFSDGASEIGDQQELDGFVDQIGDILMLIRKRLQQRPS